MEADSVLTELDRISSSRAFRSADRLKALLRYLVTEALQQRAELLKEYSIGIEVFGRPSTFDPRLDSIVRTQAHKLRAKLSAYYEAEGGDDPVRIELPRGNYAPIFSHAAGSPALNAPSPRGGSALASVRLLVLPFANRIGSGSGERFSGGLTDELSHALALVPGLDVIAPSYAAQFKDQAAEIGELAQRLQVQAILEGSVRRLGNQLRILVQLVDPVSRSTLWTQSYDRRLMGALGLQQEIASTITRQLQPYLHFPTTPVADTPPNVPAAGFAVDREAYRHYSQGLRYFARHTPEDMAEASRLFELAVAKNTRFTQGYTHLAYSYCLRAVLEAALPSDLVVRSREAASKALEIDPLAGAAHIALALWRLQNYQWHEAGNEFRKGLELSPSDALGHAWYGIYLASFGRPAEALEQEERALELETAGAMSSWSYGLTLFVLRRYSDARRHFRQSLVGHPSFWRAHIGLGMIALQERNYGNAIAEFERAQPLTLGLGRERGKLAYAYAGAGNKDRARDILNELLSDRSAAPGQTVAEIYIGLGDNDSAFQWLHRAIDQNDVPAMLTCDPIFDPLRADSRFSQLLSRVKMI